LGRPSWDGTPRLDTWLIDYLNAPDTRYVRAVGTIILIAAVRRLREPGAKFDELLISESQQGVGKSTALRNLACGEQWFTDNLHLRASAKVIIEQTSGFWIVEVPDL
jgi:predicted P-loop ATPase